MNIKPQSKSTLTATLVSLGIALATQASNASSIESALAAQSEEVKARFEYRNPQATLDFFNVKEGMTVVEALPGGGWYSKILLPALGEEGKLVGVDYALEMWSNFDFMTPERIEAKKTWVETWSSKANEWRNDGDGSVAAFQFDALPNEMKGSADAVLFIRALHNLFRFEENGGYLSKALKETHAVLKEGGVVGVVQHQAREDRPDDWADGRNGYLKKSAVIEHFEKHGFELVGESKVNENDKDQANEGDFVWRLPPSLSGSKDDADKRAAMLEIGESHRMTLLFKKV